MGNRKNQDDGLIGCIAAVLLGILFMPFVGAYFIASKNPERKALGWILLVVGCVLWFVFLISKA